MWIHEHAVETAVRRDLVWQALADIDNWTTWDTSMQEIKLTGPFEVGGTVAMTPIGQDPIVSTIVEIVEGRLYADETSFGGVTLRFSHTLEDVAEGTRIVHRLEITGDAADELGPEIGPQITEDFPEAMDGLIKYAGSLG
jgi:hypothetical protein